MPQLQWERHGEHDCLVVRGVDVAQGAHRIRVVPTRVLATRVEPLPSMAGRVEADRQTLRFVPRFPFVAGTSYSVLIGDEVLSITRAARPATPTTAVAAVHPTASVLPRNALRLYIVFSAPMREGQAASHVRIVRDDTLAVIDDVLLPFDHELWDAERRRLTVFLDPARIKRGLLSHRAVGYPLQPRLPIRVAIDRQMRDAYGAPLVAPAERRYAVGDDLRGHVDPTAWTVDTPRASSRRDLVIGFDRPLDRGLLAHCLNVVDPGGHTVRGVVEIGDGDTTWRLVPRTPWKRGTYTLMVNPILEDIAGNSLTRVFDRDLGSPNDAPTLRPVTRMPLHISS